MKLRDHFGQWEGPNHFVAEETGVRDYEYDPRKRIDAIKQQYVEGKIDLETFEKKIAGHIEALIDS